MLVNCTICNKIIRISDASNSLLESTVIACEPCANLIHSFNGSYTIRGQYDCFPRSSVWIKAIEKAKQAYAKTLIKYPDQLCSVCNTIAPHEKLTNSICLFCQIGNEL